MEKGFTALGLMSGTSMDGVDAAILRTDGVKILEHGPVGGLTYSDENREVLENAVATARHWSGGPEPQPIYKAAALVSDTHARLVKRVLDSAGIESSDIDFLGFHGQTVLHKAQMVERSRLAMLRRLPILPASTSLRTFASTMLPRAARELRWRRSITRHWCARAVFLNRLQ